MKQTLIIISLLTLLISCGVQKNQKKTTFVSIGTGGVSGVYYPVGGAISKIVNQNTKKHNIKIAYESTGGSVVNINSILNGDFEFGVAQADRVYQAATGKAEWATSGPNEALRVVFGLHMESVTLVASSTSKIMTVEDLKGKRVNIGNPGSGHRQNAIDIFKSYQMDPEKDIIPQSVKASEAPTLLQDGRIDAFFYTVGHPNGNIKETTSQTTKVRFIPIIHNEMLSSNYPYYELNAKIMMSHYPNALNTNDVQTIGVRALLVTSSKVSKETVYHITKAILNDFEAFKAIHPALAHMEKENLVVTGLTSTHPGALQAFMEAGLVSESASKD